MPAARGEPALSGSRFPSSSRSQVTKAVSPVLIEISSHFAFFQSS
jgi:hypothetical protein